MKILKKYRFGFSCITLGLFCFFVFQLEDSYVDTNGILIEPFALIPVGWIFLIIGLISFLFILLKKK